MRIPLFVTFLWVSCSQGQTQQTFKGNGGTITNDGYFTEFTLKVEEPGHKNLNATFGLKEIKIDLQHTNDWELVMYLRAPDGTQIELSSVAGQGGQNYSQTCFSGDAEVSIKCGKPPFTGRFKPVDYIGTINNGQNPNGKWTLLIKDWLASEHSGKLNNWELVFGDNALVPVVLKTSNLPVIVIDTKGQEIFDTPRIIANMGISNNPSGQNNVSGPYNNFNGKVSIEIRGSSSKYFSKKSYAFSTLDQNGKKKDASILGMPMEKEWILYAPYADKTLLRNYLTYNLSQSMGNYAPRCEFAELVINGIYHGVYMVTEKIKRDENRVNIAHIDNESISDTSISGGYIFKIDRYTPNTVGWFSSIPSALPATKKVFYTNYYPADSAINEKQKLYLKNYMDQFEKAVVSGPPNEFKKYLDLKSFADFFLINEFSKNVDAYRLSTYLYKDRDTRDPRLHIGPVWDYDLAWSNANYGGSQFPDEWKYLQRDTAFPSPQWWDKLMEDPEFRSLVKSRWTELRKTTLSNKAIYAVIDQTSAKLKSAAERNFVKWPVLGAQVGINPEPLPKDYEGEIRVLKEWILNRGNWMDEQINKF